jgi:hypothetical protein
MKTRLITEVGTRAFLRVYWGTCPSPWGYHNAKKRLVDSSKVEDSELGGKPIDHGLAAFPTRCDQCAAEVPGDLPKKGLDASGACGGEGVNYQVHHARLYDSPSGKPEPGDVFFRECGWMKNRGACANWDNCDGRHLIVILPNGWEWDADSRASNCTMKDDRTHRCWVRTGEPPNVTVGKTGNTCAAGAGSILTPDGWHGFLESGFLRSC